MEVVVPMEVDSPVEEEEVVVVMGVRKQVVVPMDVCDRDEDEDAMEVVEVDWEDI